MALKASGTFQKTLQFEWFGSAIKQTASFGSRHTYP